MTVMKHVAIIIAALIMAIGPARAQTRGLMPRSRNLA
jgi:hypothetical protein